MELYHQLKMIKQESMWWTVFFVPQIGWQTSNSPQILNLHPNSQLQKVEGNKSIKQEFFPKEKDKNSEAVRSLPTKKIQKMEKQALKEDSSYSAPVRQQYKTTQQKLGRNSASNILRLFTKLLKSSVFKHYYANIKQKYKFDITLKQFSSWVTGIGLNMNKYIRIKKILGGVRAKPKYGHILSMLYNLFQEKFARCAALTSSKTESKNIIPTLSQIRYIGWQINEALFQGYGLAGRNHL